MVTNKINSIEDIIKVDESIIQNINTIETNKLILYDDITMFPETSDGEVDYTNKFKLKGILVDLESSIEKIIALESSIEVLQKSLEQMETKINQHSHSSDQAAVASVPGADGNETSGNPAFQQSPSAVEGSFSKHHILPDDVNDVTNISNDTTCQRYVSVDENISGGSTITPYP